MADLQLSRQTVQESPKVVCWRIAGELDENNGRQVESYFDELVQAEQPRHVLLDLSGLIFAGSSFFGSLLFWKEEVGKNGGSLVLFGLRPEVASTMRIFALDRVLSICDDQQAALAKALGD
jgi:stage II sporulation protein AA (anti-sigma F factor antagonist)